jgi:hypothetical protein
LAGRPLFVPIAGIAVRKINFHLRKRQKTADVLKSDMPTGVPRRRIKNLAEREIAEWNRQRIEVDSLDQFDKSVSRSARSGASV